MNKENWKSKLVDLIEEEIELASGKISNKHFSGECKMNDIIICVEEVLKAQKQDLLEKIGEMKKDDKWVEKRVKEFGEKKRKDILKAQLGYNSTLDQVLGIIK